MDAKKIVEEVGGQLKEASAEERFEAIAQVALSAGFEGFLAEKVAELAPVRVEKTACCHEKPAADPSQKIRYSKLNVDDIIGHLADQFGRVEGVDKEASHRPGFAKLAKLVQEELARPT